jgi:hypothetical protein
MIEQDAQEIESNYGRDITVEEQRKDFLPQLHLHIHGENEIADEIVSVIVNKGYETSYINFDEQTVAFTPTDQAASFPDKMDDAIGKFLSDHNLIKDNGFSVYSLPNGYEVHISFIGELSYDTLTRSENALLYSTNNIEISFRGFHSGMLVLEVTCN